MALREPHKKWLSSHPNRSEKWLLERLADGFQVHHIDSNKHNNDPSNLLLVDGADHMRMHGIDPIKALTMAQLSHAARMKMPASARRRVARLGGKAPRPNMTSARYSAGSRKGWETRRAAKAAAALLALEHGEAVDATAPVVNG